MFFVGVLLLCDNALVAQGIKVKLFADRIDYLPNESLLIGVSIENFSGQPVVFGQHREWIRFLILDIKLMTTIELKII